MPRRYQSLSGMDTGSKKAAPVLRAETSCEAAPVGRMRSAPTKYRNTSCRSDTGPASQRAKTEQGSPSGRGRERHAYGASSTAATWDDCQCQLCGSAEDDEKMVLCDRCDGGYHIYCLRPKVKDIPDGEWLCADCNSDRAGKQTTEGPRTQEEDGEFLHQHAHNRVLDAPVAIDAQRFEVVEQDAIHAHLREHGFAVVKGVADEKEISKAKKLLWDYLERYGEGELKRDDPDTWWSAKAWAPNAKDGIVYGCGVGHRCGSECVCIRGWERERQRDRVGDKNMRESEIERQKK